MRPLALALLIALLLPAAAAAAPPDPTEDREVRRALALQDSGRYDLSVPLLEAVLARLPNDPDILTYLALALRRSGRHTEAEARYSEALARDANHAPAIAYQGVLFLETGRRDLAEANLRRLEALCPHGCAAREDLAREFAARR
jgi:Flp pilus assembly protein TadD